MGFLTSFFAFAVIGVLRNEALEYSDLEMLGASCPLRDSCQQISNSNFSQRNCECDRLCSAFGDCCIDAPVPTTPRRYRRNSRLKCMQFGKESFMGAYVVGNCPRNFVGPPAIQTKCQEQDDFSDPLISVPVTDTSSGVAYRNRYCAECNRAFPSNLQSWLIFLNCESLASYNFNDTYIWNNLQYQADISRWGVYNNQVFHSCELLFDKPSYITTGIRLCRPGVVSTCPSNWDREAVKRACESYMAVVYGSSNDTYRNAHCAICNWQMVTNVFCDNMWVSSRVKKPFSFALLVDINPSDGNIVGEVQRCPSGQKYDPFFKKCRTLVCALPGYTMVNGKCKKN